MPATPLSAIFYGPDNLFIETAFLDPATGSTDLRLTSSSSTSLVYQQPSTGAITTMTGTGLTVDTAGVPTGGTVTDVTFEQGGTTVATFAGMSWDIVAFRAAVDTMSTDMGPLDALFSSQPLVIDARPATVAFVLDGSNWTSNMTVTGSDYADMVRTGAGDDSVRGGLGDDSFSGGAGDDTIKGQAGNDSLFGHGGRDLMYGGDGQDTINGQAGGDKLYGGMADDLITGGSGDDLIAGGDGDDLMSGNKGNDVLKGGIGNDTIHGNGGHDAISGNRGDDVLFGGGGNDTLNGNDGNDSLFGGSGNNLLRGGAGTDTLHSGTGDDTLAGGADADVFLFDKTAGTGANVITDFQDTIDMLDVSGLGLAAADITIAASGTSDTLITLGTYGTVTLTGIDATLITVADDFILV